MSENRKKILRSMVRDKVRLMIEDDKYTLTVKNEERDILQEIILVDGEKLKKKEEEIIELMGKLSKCKKNMSEMNRLISQGKL